MNFFLSYLRYGTAFLFFFFIPFFLFANDLPEGTLSISQFSCSDSDLESNGLTNLKLKIVCNESTEVAILTKESEGICSLTKFHFQSSLQQLHSSFYQAGFQMEKKRISAGSGYFVDNSENYYSDFILCNNNEIQYFSTSKLSAEGGGVSVRLTGTYEVSKLLSAKQRLEELLEEHSIDLNSGNEKEMGDASPHSSRFLSPFQLWAMNSIGDGMFMHSLYPVRESLSSFDLFEEIENEEEEHRNSTSTIIPYPTPLY